jgi:hypothetical protein
VANPDFGKGGQLTIRKDETGAPVATSAGESIRCKVTAKGPGQAVFSFTCEHRPICKADTFTGHPKPAYDWTRFTNPGDADAPRDAHALVLSFAGGITSYTFLMEKVDAAGQVKATLKDFDASSNVASDVYRDAIILFTS